MRFLLDVNLSTNLTLAFTDAGHECTHVETLIPRYSPDTMIVGIANEVGAVVVTRDADFVEFAHNGKLTVPLVWIHLGNLRRAPMATAIRARLPFIVARIEAGDRIVEIR